VKNLVKDEHGVSLFEIVILIVIVGVALPALYTLNGTIARYHARNEIMSQAASLADSRMEDIIAFKNENDDWDTYITNYNLSESLAKGFSRKTSVSSISGWGAEGIDAYKIVVSVVHTELPNGYTLTVMLAK
jgi:Tfp pilus assembly protein PilV